MDNIAFYQTIFSLPFAYMAVLLASKGTVDWWIMLWVTMTIVSARSAALALDNMIDLKYDVDQPRFQQRPMVAGTVSRHGVHVLIGICAAVLVFSVLQLNPICIKLLPIAALPFVIYPFMKRYTCFCHYIWVTERFKEDRSILFVLNHNNHSESVQLQDRRKDLLTGNVYDASVCIEVEAKGVMILEK